MSRATEDGALRIIRAALGGIDQAERVLVLARLRDFVCFDCGSERFGGCACRLPVPPRPTDVVIGVNYTNTPGAPPPDGYRYTPDPTVGDGGTAPVSRTLLQKADAALAELTVTGTPEGAALVDAMCAAVEQKAEGS